MAWELEISLYHIIFGCLKDCHNSMPPNNNQTNNSNIMTSEKQNTENFDKL